MSLFIAAMLAGAAQSSSATAVQNLPGVFEAACLDGQARLSSGDAVAIDFAALPSGLRKGLGHPASAKVWQLSSSGKSYLYVLGYTPGPGVSPKVCGLASDSMDLRTATEALGARVAGGTERTTARSAQWVNAEDGYVATATTAAKFNVLQISWMSEEDKATAVPQVDQLPH